MSPLACLCKAKVRPGVDSGAPVVTGWEGRLSRRALNAVGAKGSLRHQGQLLPLLRPLAGTGWVRSRSSETDCFRSAGRPGLVWVRFNQLLKATAGNLRPSCRVGRVRLHRGVASPVPRGPVRFAVFLWVPCLGSFTCPWPG